MEEVAAILIGLVLALVGGGAAVLARRKPQKPVVGDSPVFDAASEAEKRNVRRIEDERDERRAELDAVDTAPDADRRSRSIADLANE